ncbi:hypothetical protein [Asticcacaulis sp.]|uniref:hypothetical protein n=1 Tax=Asticcacaulis sp. TaxID=1872648 RepID=UPI0031DF8A77
MATFVHLTTESSVASIRRNGLTPSRFMRETVPAKGVFCFPVLPDFYATHQWLHELRRRSRERICGVYFRVPDTQSVHVGRFDKQPEEMSAVEAVTMAHVKVSMGWEILIPRSIKPSEIIRIKMLPQIVGWRIYPESKGTRPTWPSPGTYGAGKMRNAISEAERKEEERYFSRFPAEWYSDQNRNKLGG